MGLLEFIILAAVIGLVVYLIWRFLPIPMPIKQVILWAAVIVLVVILLSALGVLKDVHIPRL